MFLTERMVYIPVTESTDGVAKDGKTRKTFDALDWLAHLVTHIPGRYELNKRYVTMGITAINPEDCERRRQPKKDIVSIGNILAFLKKVVIEIARGDRKAPLISYINAAKKNKGS